jgi:hypothetical protein
MLSVLSKNGMHVDEAFYSLEPDAGVAEPVPLRHKARLKIDENVFFFLYPQGSEPR